jgi:hypothetical protein
MIEDSKLVSALRKSQAITEADLERGMEISDQTGRPLYHTIIDHELAEEITAVRVAADLLNVPFVELEDVHPEPAVLEQIPPTLAFRNRVFPLKIAEEDGQRELFLAMADPIDVLAMDEVATHTGIDIRPVLAGPRDLTNALERAYHRDAAGPALLEDVEPFDADFDLEEISSFDHGSDLEEDSWEAFFDEAEDADEEDLEDSMVLSREMRDRRTSQELEPFEDESDISETDEEDALESLEEPLSESQMTGGVEADLSDWEIDERLEGEEPPEEKDYAAIGSFFVYSSEDARKERLQDLADFEERESGRVDSAPEQREEAPKQADDEPTSEPISGPQLSSTEDDVLSGVTSMSEAPFMFEDDDASASDSIELDAAEGDGADRDADSGGHTMVGRGIAMDADSDAESASDPDVEVRDDDADVDDGTSMLGGPFGIGMDEDSSGAGALQDDPSEGLGEESSGGHTMVGSIHGVEDSQAETLDGDIDVLDDDDFEIIEEPSEASLDEDSFGSQTQFGVGPQGPSAPAATGGAEANDAPTDEELEAVGHDSNTPLAQITPRGKKPKEEAEAQPEESTKSRLSGLLSKVRNKTRKSKDSEAARSESDETSAQDSRSTETTETAENPVTRAQKTAQDDADDTRETRPNRAVTELRAQAMQEDEGLASFFAQAVAETAELDEDELASLSELSPDELVYLTMLALFEKGILGPRDILDQFRTADE